MSDAIDSNTDKPAIVLDDGRYCLVLNQNYPLDRAPGFLEVRRAASGGGRDYTCVGSFDAKPDGTWEASVNVPYDESTDSDSMLLGEFDRRLDALVRLWKDRHQAALPPGY